MITLLILMLLLFLIAFVYIFYKNTEIKKLHSKKMDKLHTIIFSLHQQQEALNIKLSISNLYDINYKKEVKAIGEEIVTLQKVFVELLSNKKK